ncbi:hypothetical protein yc1106_03988 [Curvularia clavata]|uniref:Uncharacterized protein n=1 Tax=Curvularia clavata TaxID=95742 RepID=A0A9Q8Z891_CURCL|nr:hypothetical protein yc1106_03988 [Curvularia clavata]
MVNHHLQLQQQQQTQQTQQTQPSQSIFSRRPSIFGSKNRASRHTASSLSVSHTHAAPADSPPTLTLQPADRLNTPPPDDSDQSDLHSKQPPTPSRRRHVSRQSIASSVTDLGAQLRTTSRSASLRTNTSTATRKTSSSSSSHTRNHSATLTIAPEPEKAPAQAPPSHALRPSLSVSTFSRNKQKSTDPAPPSSHSHLDERSPSSLDKPKTPFAMAVPMPLRHPPTQKDILQANQQSNRTLGPAAPIPVPNGSNPNLVFQHIHELASKRISTLDYLRKAHEGRIYWFNTLLFSKTDLTRLPSYTSRNQARRATHYLLLGFSLPTILDLNANSPSDYLKALNALLVEFEQYQSMHPTDGSHPSTLSRARLPQMFKRANMGMGMGISSKGRRSSSATGDFPLLTPSNSFTGNEGMNMDSPPTDDLLLPNESYTHLQTPSLPFDPDFFSTFATLCDVLIDCYTRILSMLSTPESVAIAGGGVPSLVGDLFNKADAKVRKIILAGVVREFEDSCRAGVKSEVGGVGKVVLGGLM